MTIISSQLLHQYACVSALLSTSDYTYIYYCNYTKLDYDQAAVKEDVNFQDVIVGDINVTKNKKKLCS